MQPLDGIFVPDAKRNLRPRVAKIALIAASLGGAVMVGTTGRFGWGTVAATVAFAVVAAILAVGEDGLDRWRIRHRRRRSSSVIRASHFEVVATARRDDAEHQLASWWDPAASPAGSR